MAVKRTKLTTRSRRANTADILGNPEPGAPIPSKWKKHHALLVKARAQLLRRQDDLVKDAAEAQPIFSLHMADAGTDTFDRDLALSRASSEQNALYEIEDALRRIQNGTYGVCELTGKRIEAARLEAVPWTRFSGEAEKQLEKDDAVPRAKLGPRQSVPRATDAGGEAGNSAEDERAD